MHRVCSMEWYYIVLLVSSSIYIYIYIYYNFCSDVVFFFEWSESRKNQQSWRTPLEWSVKKTKQMGGLHGATIFFGNHGTWEFTITSVTCWDYPIWPFGEVNSNFQLQDYLMDSWYERSQAPPPQETLGCLATVWGFCQGWELCKPQFHHLPQALDVWGLRGGVRRWCDRSWCLQTTWCDLMLHGLMTCFDTPVSLVFAQG